MQSYLISHVLFDGKEEVQANFLKNDLKKILKFSHFTVA